MSTQKYIDVAGNQYVEAVMSVGPASGAQTSVASSATDVTLLASNTSRQGAMIYNDSTAVLYVLLAAGTSSATNYSIQLAANAVLSIRPGEYSGIVKGLWAAANGNARVTEFS